MPKSDDVPVLFSLEERRFDLGNLVDRAFGSSSGEDVHMVFDSEGNIVLNDVVIGPFRIEEAVAWRQTVRWEINSLRHDGGSHLWYLDPTGVQFHLPVERPDDFSENIIPKVMKLVPFYHALAHIRGYGAAGDGGDGVAILKPMEQKSKNSHPGQDGGLTGTCTIYNLVYFGRKDGGQ